MIQCFMIVYIVFEVSSNSKQQCQAKYISIMNGYTKLPVTIKCSASGVSRKIIHCKFCLKDINVVHMEIGALKQHAGKKTHQTLVTIEVKSGAVFEKFFVKKEKSALIWYVSLLNRAFRLLQRQAFNHHCDLHQILKEPSITLIIWVTRHL